MLETEEGKTTFSRVAADYDAVRPSYPDELVRHWHDVSKVELRSNVAEFGCGSGQLTKKLAPFGFSIIASDISEELLEIAAINCAAYPNVSFVRNSFEEFEADPASFDAVVVATAFHWFDPATRWRKMAKLVRPCGTVAIAQNIHRHEQERGPIRERLDEIYDRVIPPEVNDKFQTLTKKSLEITAEIDQSPEFELLSDTSYWHENVLSGDNYLRFLNTSSFQHNLPTPVKSRLFNEIRAVVIENGDCVASTYEARLIIAGRR